MAKLIIALEARATAILRASGVVTFMDGITTRVNICSYGQHHAIMCCNLPIDFDNAWGREKLMARPISGARRTCESCISLDVRLLHRRDLLRTGLRYGWEWPREVGAADIRIETENDAILLTYRVRRLGASDWKDIRQHVPLTWTNVHLGGRRPWFKCPVSSYEKCCETRVAKLYLAGDWFGCRHCWGLAYASQQVSSEPDPGLDKAQKIRIRLGGTGSIMAPFPPKPKGMHWKTYYRLQHDHYVAEGRWLTAMKALFGEPPRDSS
jgi:hypothetical protein